ncbi:Copia protein, partial [Mucuna pruriens]
MINEFEMSDLGLLSYFLGIEFEMTRYEMEHQQRLDSLKKETVEEQVDPTHYRRIVGCMRYLCNTRPYLNFSMGLVNRFMQEAKQSHLLAIKRILRDIDFEILFPKKEVVVEPELVGYSDSDWCGDKKDRKSTARYIFFHEGEALHIWLSYDINFFVTFVLIGHKKLQEGVFVMNGRVEGIDKKDELWYTVSMQQSCA